MAYINERGEIVRRDNPPPPPDPGNGGNDNNHREPSHYDHPEPFSYYWETMIGGVVLPHIMLVVVAFFQSFDVMFEDYTFGIFIILLGLSAIINLVWSTLMLIGFLWRNRAVMSGFLFIILIIIMFIASPPVILLFGTIFSTLFLLGIVHR